MQHVTADCPLCSIWLQTAPYGTPPHPRESHLLAGRRLELKRLNQEQKLGWTWQTVYHELQLWTTKRKMKECQHLLYQAQDFILQLFGRKQFTVPAWPNPDYNFNSNPLGIFTRNLPESFKILHCAVSKWHILSTLTKLRHQAPCKDMVTALY